MTITAVKPSRANILRSRKGLATVEAIPLLVLFVMLTGFAIGMWGAVHSAILQSIAARTYAFETFDNRSNLTIHRLNKSAAPPLSMSAKGIRFHSVKSESASPNGDEFKVTTRPLAIGYPSPTMKTQPNTHTEKIFDLKDRNQSVEVGPIWVMVGYGMCLNVTCGDR